MRSSIAVFVLLCLTAVSAAAEQIEIPIEKTSISPHGCALDQPVFVGWTTAATLVVHPDAQALSLRTSDEFDLQLNQPSHVSDEDWLEMIKALQKDGFVVAKAMIGLNLEIEPTHLGISVSYELNAENRRCHIMRTDHALPAGTTYGEVHRDQP